MKSNFGVIVGLIFIISASLLIPDKEVEHSLTDEDLENYFLAKEVESWSDEKIEEFSKFLEDLIRVKKGDIIKIKINHDKNPTPFKVVGLDETGLIIKPVSNSLNDRSLKLFISPFKNLINSFEMIEEIEIKNINIRYT